MAELADALDSKSSGKPCGFESHHRYQNKKCSKSYIFFEKIKRWDSKRNVPSLGWFKARLNAGKNSPVDYFCDARASGPTIGTRIKNVAKATFFLKEIQRWDSKRNVPSLGWFKARLNAGKNSPVDYFCDASASGPTIGTKLA